METLWQGSANQWDCDEMGHMNVRIYVEKMMEGLGSFAHMIEMPHAFKPHSPSTLQPTDQHIRFIREVHPGRPLIMVGGVLEIGQSDVLLYQELRHGDGSAAASFRTRVQHITSKTGLAFAWTERTRAALETMRITPPEHTAPRSIDPEAAILDDQAATLAAAHNAGAPRIGLGHVPAHQCDAFGRMRTEWFMGRISDSVPNLLYDWRKQVAGAAGGKPMGAAVLEYRLVYRGWPKAGDRIEAYSSFARAEEKVHSIVHWLVDPDTGNAWLTSEAVAVTFDLETRKIIPTAPEQLAQLQALAPSGLGI
ncbi:MAG: thioesterase family protein [Hyphomonadaceae bacterium]